MLNRTRHRWRRGRPTSLARSGWWLALVLYLAVIASLTLTPGAPDRSIDPHLLRVLHVLHLHGVPRWVDYSFVEKSANVVMFVAYGVILAGLLGVRRWWLAIVIGVATSGVIEASQWLFLPGRQAAVSDLVTNSVGGAIGTAVVVLARRCRRRAPV